MQRYAVWFGGSTLADTVRMHFYHKIHYCIHISNEMKMKKTKKNEEAVVFETMRVCLNGAFIQLSDERNRYNIKILLTGMRFL